MSIVKRFNRLLGLEKIDVLVDEKDKSRHIVITDMPESLPQGKSSFLIEVSPYMRKGIELQIDFIDSKGNSIYVEPVSNYLEGTSRTVSVEVYNTVAPGVATMIIVGELEGLPLEAGNYSETEEIPDEFKGVYNVRLTKEVIINTAEINTQPIKFYSSPRLTAVEKRFGTMEREVISGETTSSAFSIKGKPTQQEEFSIFTSNESDVESLGAGVTDIDDVPRPPDGDIKGDDAHKQKLKRFNKKRTVRGDSRFKRSKRIRRRRSPEEYPYVFQIDDDNHEFTTEEIGGVIKFSNIVNIYESEQLEQAELDGLVSFNVVTDVNDDNFPTHYTASIAKLENNKTAYVNTPFTKQDKQGNYRLLPMEATGKVHYTPEPTASYSVTNIVSYADVTLSHLRTFSGEVFKAKVYVRAEGSQDDYKLLAEVPVESPELMVNENSVGIGERTGYFVSDSDLNTYWEKFGGTNGLSAATSTTTASFDNSGSLDSVMISGSISSFTDQIRFQQKDAYKFNLTKGIDYDLSFNAVGEKGTDGRALLMVYVSGSSVKQQSNLHFDETEKKDVDEPFQYGKRMGVLEVEIDDAIKKNFGLVRHNFNPNLTGDAKVQFRVISGKWNLSDISVVPSTDTGFSPSFVNFQQELPPELTHKRPEKLEFLTEFYDINNNLADEIAVTTGSNFTGGNMVITGEDNVLEQNLFIGGDTTGSGIHMGGTTSTLPDNEYSAGASGSGFIRSIGYLGFQSASNSALGGKKGFMIYSGSVLPNSGEDYKGVGLELVGESGSLKFRTSPSLFDVQADAFFVGKTTTQFISGSGQNIEISSSNFHVTPEGNVTMSGTITAEAGNIGGFTIEDSRLTAGAGNSSVTMSGADQLFRFGSGSQFDTTAVDGILFGKDTDGQYKFAIGKGNSYILFDGTAVNIRSEDINVTASVFSVDVDVFKLSANNLFISSSDGGFISAGNPRPSGIGGTNKGFFVQGNNPTDGQPKFLVGAATASHISFDGTNIFMSSSAFFLGGPSQFVSGSNGNIEISSSNFHLQAEGDVTMSGNIKAAGGDIAGWTIEPGFISKALSGSAAYQDITRVYLSATQDNVKNIAEGLQVYRKDEDIENGQVKVVRVGGLSDTTNLHANNDYGIQIIQKDSNNNYSNILYVGEATQSLSGLDIGTGTITSPGGGLVLSGSGEITGSQVLFTGGKIGGWNLSTTGLTDATGAVQFSSTEASMSLGTGQEIVIRGNSNSPFISIQPAVALADKAYGEAGIFMGVPAGGPPLFSVVGGANSHIKFNGSVLDIKSEKAIISGSDVTLETPRFFLGKVSTTFVSGSNGNIEISSSKFHLTRGGDVTGSAILLGNKGAGQFLQFANNTLTVQGAITADSIAVPSAATTPSSSIASTGLLTTVSASIGGFDITSAEIKDKDDNLILKSSGQITGSNALLTGGKIAAWSISGNNISSTGGGIRLNGNGNSAEISVNSHTFGNEGIQFGFNSGNPRFYVGDGAQNFLRYDSSNGVNIKTLKATISGSEITLETPKFFLGRKTNQFVSGSNGNIEISSSNFHLTPQGNVTMSGDITAAGGTIGGFTIGDDLSSTAGTLKLKGASGQITASAAQIIGNITADTIVATGSGVIGGFSLDPTTISSSNGALVLKSSGQITASAVSMSGTVTATAGNIAGFQISGTKLQQGTSFNLDGNASADFFISSSDFQVTPSGDVSGSKVLFTGGTIGGWTISTNRFNSSDDNFRITSTGAITIKNHAFGQSGFQVIENGGTTQFYVGNGTTRFIKFDGSNVDIGTEKLTASGSSISLGAPSFKLGSGTNFISGSGGSLVIKSSGTTTISGSAVTIETPKFFFGKAGSQFLSGSNNVIEISSSKFHLQRDGDVVMNNITASNANISGKMTATSGEIGGFTIGDDLSNSAGQTLRLKGSSGQITASAAKITGDIVANTITANTTGSIANFVITSEEIKDTVGNLRLKSSGQITASAANIQGKITATSGQIAGFTISGNTLTATNFTLDASGKSISLGTGTDIFIADGDTGIQLGHGTFGSAPFSVTKAGVLKATSGTIGGWQLSSTFISSSNLIIDSAGVIQTSDYVSNEKGWRLSPANSGEAEFQNVKIRGTLSTAVFEKETVNAVGGQLYIANSTALTGSATLAATSTTMSVANVGGFVANEVLSAKKVSATGFATEYMLVQSASRDFPTSETDFRGKLYVVRGYQSGSTGTSGSLGDSSNISQSFEPGQVIVSTGKVGTGYIRLNANPNDVTTPYIDIVERTGSGVYAVDLKARLGDLSGLSSGLLYGNSSPGFGLFTENVFLQGAITATTGSFTGKVHVGTTDGIVIDGNSKKLYQGTGTHGNSNTGFYFDSEGSASLGDKLTWDGTTLTVTGAINITSGTGFATAASVSGSFGTAAQIAGVGEGAATSASNAQAAGIGAAAGAQASASAFADSVEVSASNYGAGAQASASLFADNAELSASHYGTGAAASASAVQTNLNTVSSSVSSRIMTDIRGKVLDLPEAPSGQGLYLNYPHMGYYDNSEFKAFISASGAFLFKSDSENLVSFGVGQAGGNYATSSNFILRATNAYLSGSSINLLTDRFFFGSTNQFISGSNGNLKIFSTGDTTLSGSSVDIQTPKFFLGKRSSQFVSGSNNLIEISSSKFHLKNDGNVIMNQITASDANVSGDITANTITANTAGTIGGFNINSVGIKSSNSKLVMSASGQLTASSYRFEGDGVITGSVTIGTSATILGSLSAGSIATPSSGPPYKSEINSQGFAKFTSASIGGFEVTSTQINSTSNNIVLQANGSASISGSNITLKSPDFFFGDTSNFISGSGGNLKIFSTGNTTLSGSSVTIKTPDFFLGKLGSQFVSGSNNNIEITSSMFHLDPANSKVAISGSITATTGKIGGMLLENNKLKSQYGDGSTVNHTVIVNGSTKYEIDGVQQPTLTFKVGNIYKFDNSHSSNSGHPFRFSSTSDGSTYSTGVTVSGTEGQAGAYVQIAVTSATPNPLYYKCNSHGSMGGQINIVTIGTLELNGVNGQITASDMSMSGTVVTDDIDATGGTIGGFALTSTAISSSNNKLRLKSNGQITASAVSMSGTIVASAGNVGGFIIDSSEVRSSNNNLRLKSTGQITASAVSMSGNINASGGDIGGFKIGTDLDSTSGTLKLKGVSGQITASAVSMSGTVVASSGNVGGFIIDSSEVRSSNNNLRLKSTGQITASAVSMSGNINASGGDIGGFVIGSTQINSTNDKLILKSTGQITASAVSMSGTVVASGGEIGGFVIDSSEVKSTNNNLRLKDSGQITASNAQILGNITADTIVATGSGVIGGFTLDAHSLTSTGVEINNSSQTLFISSSAFKVDHSGNVTASNISMSGTVIADSGEIGGFKIGTDLDSTSGTLKLKGATGQITASDAQILGNITANTIVATGSGVIGGFSLDPTTISSSNGALVLKSTGQITASAVSMSGNINASGGDIGGFVINSTQINSTNDNLILKSTGQITASAVSMSGTIVADSGNIGGFIISSDRITGGNLVLRNNGAINAGNFQVDSSGNISTAGNSHTIQGTITANVINATGSGTIGGFSLDPTTISSSNGALVLKSTGQITASAVSMSGTITADSGNIGGNRLTSGSIFSGTGTFGNSNTPFFLDSGGRFSLKNKLSFNGSTLSVNRSVTATGGAIGNWDIESDNIVTNVVDDEAIVLDASTGGGAISVGDTTFGNTGIQLQYNNNNPRFHVGKSNGSFLKFNSQTNILQISSSTFEMGSRGSAFISASSAGTLEISSSNFHLTTAGEVTMSANITAAGGNIGGWTMTSSSLSSGTTGATMDLQSSTNRIILRDAAKPTMTGADLIQIGELVSSADLPFGSNSYGIVLSGSNSSMGNNEVKMIAEMGDYGTPSDNFQYTSSVIQGKVVSKGGSIGGGRAGIYGESAFELGSTLPFGYAGSLSSQKGIMAGVVGSHRNFNNGFYRKAAGVMGVSGVGKLNKTDFGSLIRTGSFGVVSVGPMYVTASTADHEESGIGYSILAGSGYIHVSASSAGNFGGIGSGMIIDSSNTSGTSAGLRLVSDLSNTTEITSNGTGVQINKGVINTTGDTTFSGSYFASNGTINRLDGGVIATSFARNGSTGVTINHSTGGITAGGDLDVGGTYTNDTQPAFLARNTSVDSSKAKDTYHTVDFNSEVYDQANNFSSDTFTAPVTGKYLLSTQVRLDDIQIDANWYSLEIITSNRNYRRFIDPVGFDSQVDHFGMSLTVVADMDATDTAYVRVYQSGGTTSTLDIEAHATNLDTFFSGYLLG